MRLQALYQIYLTLLKQHFNQLKQILKKFIFYERSEKEEVIAKNSKGDVAQLQAVFGHLKYDSKPYWGGAIDGIWTEDLAASLR